MGKLLTTCRSVLYTPLGQWSTSTWSGSRQMFLVLAVCSSAEQADKLIKATAWCGGAVQLNSQNLTLTFPLHRVEYRSILCSTTHENLLIMILVYI
jgi:hypothetical protein